MSNLGLYIHIPFCLHKCGYCDFYSVESADARKDRYLDALYDYIDSYSMQAAGREIDTVYIGGGTPTCLDTAKLIKLIKTVKKKFNISKNCEFSIEVNPGTVNFADLKNLKNAGVTRLSIGAQSVHDDELTALTRIYRASQLFSVLEAANKAKFDNVSVDIMYGIPHQTLSSLIETVDKLTNYSNITHISLYGLMIEEGTDFFKYRDILPLPDEETERNMYFEAAKHLEDLGYKQYEISNFAKPSYECRHNLKYWNCDEYIGIGPGAHSYFSGKRFSYKKDLDIFTGDKISDDQTVLDEYMEIQQKDRIGEYVMLRFRLNDGIDTNEFYKKFGVEFDDMYFDRLSPYIYRGLVAKDRERYFFTREGMYVSNSILSNIIDW